MQFKISKDKFTVQTDTLLKNKSGHLYTITFVDYSKNNIIATGSWDGTVRLYTEKEQIEVIYFFKDPIEGLKFSPNGKMLAVGIENEIHIFDMNTKKSFRVLPRENAIRGATFTWSDDSSRLACILFDHSIRIYDVISQKEIGMIPDVPSLGGTYISWKKDYLAVGLNNGNISIYNLNSAVFQLAAILESHTDMVNAVLFSDSENGLLLYSVSNDKTIRSWDFNNNFNSKIISTSDSALLSLSVRQTLAGQILIVCSESENIVFIEEYLQFKIKLKNKSYCNVAINTHADKFIRGIDEHDLGIFSIKEKQLISKLEGKDDYINATVLLNDNELLYASHDKSIHYVNLQNNQEYTFKGHSESVSSLAVSSDRKFIVSSAFDDTIFLWNLEEKKVIRTVTTKAELPNCVLFSSDNNTIFCASGGDFSIRGYSLTGEKIFSENIHDEYVNRLIAYKSGFFSIGDDKKIVFWENSKGKVLFRGDSEIISVSISLNQELLAFGTIRGVITIIEIKSGEKKLELKLNKGVNCCVFSPDDQFIAIGSHTKLYIYDITNAEMNTIFTFFEPTKDIFWLKNGQSSGINSTLICISVAREVISTKFYLTEKLVPKIDKLQDTLQKKDQQKGIEIESQEELEVEQNLKEPELIATTHESDNLKEKIVEEVKFLVNSENEFQEISDYSTNLNKNMSSLELGSLVYKEYMETLKHLDKIQEMIQLNSDETHEGFKVILNRINRLKPVINEALEEIDFILD